MTHQSRTFPSNVYTKYVVGPHFYTNGMSKAISNTLNGTTSRMVRGLIGSNKISDGVEYSGPKGIGHQVRLYGPRVHMRLYHCLVPLPYPHWIFRTNLFSTSSSSPCEQSFTIYTSIASLVKFSRLHPSISYGRYALAAFGG